jgi:hypothetical protein
VGQVAKAVIGEIRSRKMEKVFANVLLYNKKYDLAGSIVLPINRDRLRRREVQGVDCIWPPFSGGKGSRG